MSNPLSYKDLYHGAVGDDGVLFDDGDAVPDHVAVAGVIFMGFHRRYLHAAADAGVLVYDSPADRAFRPAL